MLHPVKVSRRCTWLAIGAYHWPQAATSFDCDGCNHHASFHSLENVEEDAVLKKWSELESRDATEGASNKKRRRIAEKPANDVEILELSDGEGTSTTITSTTRKKAGKQRVTKASQASSRRDA